MLYKVKCLAWLAGQCAWRLAIVLGLFALFAWAGGGI